MRLTGTFLIVAFLTAGVQAHADAITVQCSYSVYGTPFADVKLDLYPDGSVSPLAEVSMQGQVHTETATAVARATGEMMHYWIAKESDQNQLEVIVFEKPTAKGQSKMINHRMPPIGREIWGNCAY